MNKNIDPRVRDAAARLRKIREMKGLTREKFCEPLGENSEYWGLIERGEQAISLVSCCRYVRSMVSPLRV